MNLCKAVKKGEKGEKVGRGALARKGRTSEIQRNQVNHWPFLRIFCHWNLNSQREPGSTARAKERVGKRAIIPNRVVGRRKRRLGGDGDTLHSIF